MTSLSMPRKGQRWEEKNPPKSAHTSSVLITAVLPPVKGRYAGRVYYQRVNRASCRLRLFLKRFRLADGPAHAPGHE